MGRRRQSPGASTKRRFHCPVCGSRWYRSLGGKKHECMKCGNMFCALVSGRGMTPSEYVDFRKRIRVMS